MKKIITILLVSLGCATVFGQTKSENYIKTTQPQYATSTPPLSVLSRPKLETVVYYDGLGRPKQQIEVGLGPDERSVIQHFEYELNIGQVKEYLPYVSYYNPDGDNGLMVRASKAFASNAKASTEAFYNTVKYERTTIPYSESELEKSPLKRVLKQGSPGNDWKIGTSSAHNVTYSYGFNTTNQVKNFKAVATWNASLKQYDIRLVDQGFYVANKLYVTTTKDEDGNSSTQFTDQEGKVLVTSTELDYEAIVRPTTPNVEGMASANAMSELEGKSVSMMIDNADAIATSMTDQVGDNFNVTTPNAPNDPIFLSRTSLYTYYVYDQYNNLTYVLPPLAKGQTDTTTLDKLCYQYKYDQKNRLVAKKLPGKEWEYLVYDKADRLLAQGPLYSPFGDEGKGWMFNKYDAFGRVVYSGYYTGTPATEAGRNTFQGLVEATAPFHETQVALDTTIDQVRVPYTNETMPKTGVKMLSVNYYDRYSFVGAPTNFADIEAQTVLTNVKGLPTGSWTRVITTASEVQGTLNYLVYGEKERVLRSYKTNNLGGYTQVDSKYNFRGLVTKTVTSHKYKNDTPAKVITETYTYDQAERLLYQTHKIDNLEQVVVFQNVYDELGRVKQKRVGGKMGRKQIANNAPIEPQSDLLAPFPGDPDRSTFLQEINYTYNIRGWLTKVNDVSNLDAGDFGKKALFAMKLGYNTLDGTEVSGVKKRYNGTIAEQSWKTSNDNILRRYGYGYDRMDRLKTGIYQQPGGTTPIKDIYNESMTYDHNGNILTLNRKGKGVNAGVALDIDKLSYTYDGNILQKVVDASNNTDGFKQGSTAAKHYDYDTFGNLKVDRNKGITAIKYNHLNLPTEVVFANGKINYLYTATGEKVQKKVTQGSTTTVTDYVDGFQYVAGALSFFPTAEGYFNAETQNYVYQHLDHLGNVRVSYSDANKNNKIDVGEIVEENNYYPFGLAHKGYNEKNNTIAKNYKYQYNGKENQEELGFNVYDYGARNYDAAIGRWMNVDPLAEQATNWTPYRYGYSNPVNFIDPTGMLETQYKDEDGQTLLNTKDGSDDVVTVSNDKKKDFKHYNASYQSGNKSLYDSQKWNDNMKADLLGFSTINEMNATLGGFTTQWSRQNAINYLQNPTLANAMAMSVSESLSQWTDPEKLIMGASILIGSIPGRGGTTIFRAVDTSERNVINSRRIFSLQEGGVESKYFAKSIEDAHWYGKRLYPNGYSIIEGNVQSSVNIKQYWYPNIDIGAYVVPKEVLPRIKPVIKK